MWGPPASGEAANSAAAPAPPAPPAPGSRVTVIYVFRAEDVATGREWLVFPRYSDFRYAAATFLQGRGTALSAANETSGKREVVWCWGATGGFVSASGGTGVVGFRAKRGLQRRAYAAVQQRVWRDKIGGGGGGDVLWELPHPS